MAKPVRIYQLARELNVESKEILRLLNERMNIDINNHMSAINDQVAAKIRYLIKGPDEEPKKVVAADGARAKKKAGDRAEVPAATQGVPRPGGAGRPVGAPYQGVPRPGGAGRPVGAPYQGGPRPGGAGRPGGAPYQGGPRPGGAGRPGGAPYQGRPRPGGVTARPGAVPAPATTTRARPGKPWEAKKEERKEEEVSLAKLRRGGGREAGERRRGVDEVTLRGPLTVGELASMLKLQASEIIMKLMSLGVMATINQQIDIESAVVVCEEMGITVNVEEPEEEPTDEELLMRITEEEDPARLRSRSPVVTVLGHVDHGKTTLLDAIRETKVVSTEAGGITQHIGASTVEKDGKRIVFLDTPGHEAFTAMRARGAKVTDVAVLVVAADDGVKPQTVEALNHAREAKVPIIVAINKIDKPGANPDRVKQQLSEQGLIPEEWGGDTVYVQLSALKKQGITDLFDMINLVAEMKDLRANPDRPAVGTVIEARLDRGRGPVATVLVQAGTLRIHDAFVAGICSGKVRAMMDDLGETLKEAAPSTAVEVLGFDDLPQAGDVFRVVADDRTARNMAAVRQAKRREEDMAARKVVSLADFHKRMEAAEEKELKLVVKADVQGSLEALRAALEKVHGEGVKVTMIHGGVGAITESDVMLAAAAGGVVIGFNVRPDARARDLADEEQVDIRTYRVIYEALDDMRAALAGLLAPKFEEVVLGRAEVRQTFKVPGMGTVAGLYVTDGKIQRNAFARVVRDGTVVHEGEIASLRRFKDDVREVAAGYECGLGLARFGDLKEGDVIEVFTKQEVRRESTAGDGGVSSFGGPGRDEGTGAEDRRSHTDRGQRHHS